MNVVRRWGRQTGKRSRGQSLVELAVVLPLMMTLIMGVIDFGWVLYANIQVAAASFEGARVGSLYKGDNLNKDLTANQNDRAGAVRAAIYNASASPPTSALGMLNKTDTNNFRVDNDVTVTYVGTALNAAGQGQEMTVKVSYHQPLWFSVLPGLHDGRFDVSTTTKVRVQ